MLFWLPNNEAFSLIDALIKLIFVMTASILIICFCHKLTNYKKTRVIRRYKSDNSINFALAAIASRVNHSPLTTTTTSNNNNNTNPASRDVNNSHNNINPININNINPNSNISSHSATTIVDPLDQTRQLSALLTAANAAQLFNNSYDPNSYTPFYTTQPLIGASPTSTTISPHDLGAAGGSSLCRANFQDHTLINCIPPPQGPYSAAGRSTCGGPAPYWLADHHYTLSSFNNNINPQDECPTYEEAIAASARLEPRFECPAAPEYPGSSESES